MSWFKKLTIVNVICCIALSPRPRLIQAIFETCCLCLRLCCMRIIFNRDDSTRFESRWRRVWILVLTREFECSCWNLYDILYSMFIYIKTSVASIWRATCNRPTVSTRTDCEIPSKITPFRCAWIDSGALQNAMWSIRVSETWALYYIIQTALAK